MKRLKTLYGKGFNLGTRGLLSAALTVAALGLAAAPASAATVVVNTATDQALGSCSGSCSLRDAVFVANPGDIVSVPAGTYILTQGQIQIDKDLIVAGAGARTTIVDGNQADRIFDILSGAVEITDLTLTRGLAFGYGGAIQNQGSLRLLRSTVKENFALFAGGGIATYSGRLTVDQSTLSGNFAVLGGGIAQFGTGGEATIVNSTLSGNVAQATGGAWSCGTPPHPVVTLTIHNSTITGNSSLGTNGGAFDLICSGLPEISLVNTIVAGNPGGDCSPSDTSFLSSHSLDSDGTCPLSGPGDLPATDPLLDPLADNGGPTDTHALLAGSPALDAGDNATCLATDQRGVTRPQGPGCDIGAFETTPEDQIAALIAQVNALVSGGALAPNKANPLLTKLDQVLKKLDGGQTTAACGQLGAFINQVNAYIGNGTLTATQGQALIDATNAIRANLGC
jgi:CSLREA domain-containing protein